MPLALAQAIENGAAAFLGPQIDDSPDPESSPLSVPVIQLPDPWEALGRLGAAFYNDPSQNMTVIGVTGANSIAHSQGHCLMPAL